MDLSTVADVVQVGAATCVAIKFLGGRAVAAFAGWEGEKMGLGLMGDGGIHPTSTASGMFLTEGFFDCEEVPGECRPSYIE